MKHIVIVQHYSINQIIERWSKVCLRVQGCCSWSLFMKTVSPECQGPFSSVTDFAHKWQGPHRSLFEAYRLEPRRHIHVHNSIHLAVFCRAHMRTSCHVSHISCCTHCTVGLHFESAQELAWTLPQKKHVRNGQEDRCASLRINGGNITPKTKQQTEATGLRKSLPNH
jgi:hypothetical protein